MRKYMDIINESDAEPIAEAFDHVSPVQIHHDLTAMADLTAQLHTIVSQMHAVYDRGDAYINDLQPQSFETVIAASLDEWALRCMDCAQDWRDVASRYPSQ